MITDKSRYGHDAVLDLDCGDSAQVLRTEPMTLTEQEQKIVQKYLGIALLEKSYIDANGHLMVVLSDGRALDVGSARGLPGATPYIGVNGNWFVEGVDTLQSARGLPGFTPYIGENEHWWIDKTDTGIPARGIPLTEKADNTRFLRNDGTWQKVTPENIGAAQAGVVADHESRIEALEQRTVTAPYYTDDSVAYTKDVPENALPFASVDMVGGMTRKCTNLIPKKSSNIFNGVTATVANDGTITFSGTTIDAYNFYLYNGKIPAGSYYLSWDSSVVGALCYVYDYTTGKVILELDGKITFETEGNILIYVTQPYAERAISGSIRPMLNSGSTALPYEPYFDGLRSAPVTEVESVETNIWDEEPALGYYKVENGDFVYSSTFFASKNKIRVSPNTAYSITCSVERRIIYYDRNKKYLSGMDYNANSVITTPSNCYYMAFSTWSTYGDVYKNDIMINKGTTALPYTPYRSNTLPIPAEVQALDGYGWGVNADCYNYIDWEKKQFVKRVGCVDMGTLNWGSWASDESVFTVKFGANSVRTDSVLCDKYSTLDNGSEQWHMIIGFDKVIYKPIADSYILVRDTAYNSPYAFKAAMSGVMLYYELETPVITDISDLLPPDNLIGVEGGGTVTMVNEYGYDVPSEITYARLTWQ